MSNATVCLSTQTASRMLEGDDHIEVIVDIVTIPPHTKMSRQWQDGEEFAYVLEGFVVLHQEDKADEFYKKGDVGKVPLTQVHKLSTQEEGAAILVFSVIDSD